MNLVTLLSNLFNLNLYIKIETSLVVHVLLLQDGVAIAINTMKVNDSNISFAIPSNYAKQFLDQIEKSESMSHLNIWREGGSHHCLRIGISFDRPDRRFFP